MNSSGLLDKCEWSYAADNPKHKNHKTIEGIVIDEENSFRESDILPQFQTTFCNIVTESQYSNTEDTLCVPTLSNRENRKVFWSHGTTIYFSINTIFFKQLERMGI